MKVSDTVKRHEERGTVMNVTDDVVYVWWHTPGKYMWEPCDISTLKIIIPDDEIDTIVMSDDDIAEDDVEKLVDWVLDYKQTLGKYRAN